MKLLIKFPTRGRREQFLRILNILKEKIVLDTTKILVTIDSDDVLMNTLDMYAMFNRDGILYTTGKSKSKVDACNRDLKTYYKDFDIILLMSDDMLPMMKGFDLFIVEYFDMFFSDTDGCLHFNDGYTQDRLQTMVIFGRKYYERFGYLYHPDYISLWCDNEQMEVAMKLGKYRYNENVLFKHEHYANNPNVKLDNRYRQTEQWYHVDLKTYQRRKEIGFGVE